MIFQIILNKENKKILVLKIIWRFKLTKSSNHYTIDKKGVEGHYDLNGKSAKKALMKTPINGARLFLYGMRKHPIDGFNKMHVEQILQHLRDSDNGLR